MKQTLWSSLLLVVWLVACQAKQSSKTSEKENIEVPDDKNEQETAEEVVEKEELPTVGTIYKAQDLPIEGTYLCKNENGTTETLEIKEDGKKIFYSSSKQKKPIELKREEASTYNEVYVFFPNAPKEVYYLGLNAYSQAIYCINPDNSRQVFEKQTNDPMLLPWLLLFRGQDLESNNHYRGGEEYQVKEKFNSLTKLKNYLSDTYTEKAISEVLDILGAKEVNGKLEMSIGEGGDLSHYEQTTLTLVKATAKERTFEASIPWGDPEEGNTTKTTFQLVKENGNWKLNTPTGIGYNQSSN